MAFKVDYTVWRSVWEKEYTLTRQLYRMLKKFADKTAIIDPLTGKELTYRQWNEKSNQFANALIELGMSPGDVCMANLFNCSEWFIVYMGCAKARAVLPLLNMMLPEGQLCKLIDDADPVVLVYDSALRDRCVAAVDLAEKKPKLNVMIGEGDLPEGHVSLDQFIEGKSTEAPPCEADVRWDDAFLGLYTSGTTGLPKGFTLNHAIIFFDDMMNAAMESIDSTSVMLATNPLFHRGGNTTGVLNVLHQGGTVVVMRSFNDNLALDYIEKYKVSHMVSAPVIYEMMTNNQEKNPRDVSSLRRLVSMGAPLATESCLRMMKILCPGVMNGYGTADGHWVTMIMPWELPEQAGTIGRPIAEDEAVVVRIDMDEPGDPNNPEHWCPKDSETEGEICLRTMHSPYGYLNRPQDTAKAFPFPGWQKTGDTAVWDADGFIKISGRMDDMIITGAENVHPVIVENCIMEHPDVIDVFVTGAPSKKWGETVVAYVNLKEGAKTTADDMENFCANHPGLARYQRPRAYKFVEKAELPYNPAGKKLHYVIKERAATDFKVE
ncbi:MAG: AMP-binding protein [Deltaproteobacteria bacterium]|nr:AMP-binding protein [Deltaproteobacteria bacterium]